MTDEKPLGDSERLEFYLDDLMNDVEKDEFIANSDPHMLEKNRQIQGIS